jgi:hypothetical protein
MLAEILIIFIIATIIFFITSVYMIEDYPWLSLAFISMGLVFATLSVWGMWAVDFVYTSYNNTHGNTSFEVETVNYGNPYSFVFVFVFGAFIILLLKAGFNVLKKAKEQKGELDLK